MKLLAGTKNRDKFAEIKQILAELDIEIVSAADLDDLPDVIEDQPDIKGNAIKKATEMAVNSGMYAIADDTGLFVESLGNQPGVYSARYAGENCSYADNRTKLLWQLQGYNERSACFHTVVALADPQGNLIATAQGSIDGEITRQELGDNGFGYDSIFYSHELKKTFAEMGSEEKHRFSHRGRALRAMSEILKDLIKKINGGYMVNPKIFRQYDIRGLVDNDLTPETLYLIGRGYGTYIKRKGAKNCLIGGDARPSTPVFKQEFIRGLIDTGLNVTDIGTVATPVLYFSIWKLKADGGVVITASHNPSEYNGIKMNFGMASVFGEQIQDILQLIQKKDFDSGKGNLTNDDTLDQIYMDYIVENLAIAEPVKVIVDGGNGTGGPYLPKILRRCGCEVTELYCNMDGTFPNHHPDPTKLENMTDLISLVKLEKADIGLGLDGDADRIGVIDEKGNMLYGDQILNIIVRDFLKDNPGEKIIADVKCSKNLFDDIKAQGGIPVMYKTGHANIKMKMQQEGIKVSGEMSGHIFLKDRYLGFDDAIYVGARIVEILSRSDKPVSQMLADQPKMYNTPELHMESTDEEKFNIVAKVRDSFKEEGYEVNDIDGMRLTFPNGWALCRASNTTPVLVLRFEAETPQRLKEIQNLVETRVKQYL